MKKFLRRKNNKSNSVLAIAAGIAVAFMFAATIASIVLYNNRMKEAGALLKQAEYDQYDSYVVLIASDPDSDISKQVYSTAKEYGQKNGIYVDSFSDSIGVDYSKPELMDMAIASGCDAILLEGDNSSITSDSLAKANQAGIAVFTLETDVDSSNRVSFVGVNNYTIANLYATQILPKLDERSNVMIVTKSNEDELNTTGLITNLQEAISEKLPGAIIKYDIRIIEDDNTFATEEYVQNLFKENDVAPIVVCLDEETTTCFYQSMIDYNKVGQISLYGYYTTPTILTGIYHGVINSTVSIDATSMGEAAVDAFIEYRDTGYVSDYINVKTQIIDATNINDIYNSH